MGIPEHERRKVVSTIKLSPGDLGTLLRAIITCLDTADSLEDERYRASLLTLRDRLAKVAKDYFGGGFKLKGEMEP